MSDCNPKVKKIEYLKSKCIKSQNIRSKSLKSEYINAKIADIATLNSDVANIKTLNSDVANVKTLNSDVANIKTLNATDIKAVNATIDSLTVNKFTDFPSQQYKFNVGPTRDFKSINQVLNFLIGRVALGEIVIKIDAGTYDAISTSGIIVLNNLNISFVGDDRPISGLAYTNNTTGKYYTFNVTPQGNNTKVQIIDDISGETENVQSYGLIVGDKVAFYNNDTSIPKQNRFITANVIAVDAISFTVDAPISFASENNVIAFLPNVYIKSNFQIGNISPPGEIGSPFKSYCNILAANNSTFKGLTLLSPDSFSAVSSIQNQSSNSSFIDIVVLGTNYQEVTVNSTLYRGFTSPGAYSDTIYNQVDFESVTVFGTGYNPLTSGVGPISINNCAYATMLSLYVAGAIENTSADGIVYLFNTVASIDDIFITGNEDAIGLFMSKSSAYFSSQILVSDGVIGILVADDSSIEFIDSYVENCDIGIEVSSLSKAIFKNLTFTGNTQDFCIKDLSQVLRDGVVVVAPSC